MSTSILLVAGDGSGPTDKITLDPMNGTFSAPPPAAGGQYRIISFGQEFRGSTSDDLWNQIAAVQTKIDQAKASTGPYGHGTRVTLSIKLGNATNWVYADVLDGSVTVPPDTISGPNVDADWLQGVGIMFVCLPYLRGDPVTTTVTTAITATTGTYAVPGGGGSGGLFLADVPGEVPALARHTITDASTGSQYINRLRINAFSLRDPAAAIAQSAFTPWVDDVPSGAGIALTDATAAGGVCSTINLSSSLQRVAQFAKPSGAYNTGLFDVHVRCRDSTVLLGPPTLTALTVENNVNIGERQTASYVSASTSSATPTWTKPTLTGSRLDMAVMIQNADTIATPAGWSVGSTVTHASNTAKVAHFYINAAASRSGVETVTLTGGAVRCTVWMVETVGAAASANDISVTGTSTATTLALTSGTLAQATEMLYGFFASTGASYTVTSAFNDATEMLDTNRSIVGRARASATTTHTMTVSHTGSVDYAGVLISLKQAQSVAVAIPVGTYEVGVVACSASDTYLSTLSNTTTVTVAQTDCVIMPEWTAGMGAASVDHYRMYYRLVGGTWEWYNLPAASPYLSYTLVADAGTAANPPTSGPEATQVYFLAALSSGTKTDFTKSTVTQLGGSQWEWLHVGMVPLPPMVAADGGVPRDWIAFVEAKNTSVTGAFDVDCIVVLPHPLPSADNRHTVVAEFKQLSSTTLRRWNIEQTRDAGVSGYLSVVGGDTEAGQLSVVGESLISPGDAWLSILPDMLSGVSDVVNAQVLWTVTYVSRWIHLRGA